MTVYSKSYSAPQINKREILRYAGVTNETKEISELLEECLSICLDSLSYNVCYVSLPIKHSEKYTDLGFAATSSGTS